MGVRIPRTLLDYPQRIVQLSLSDDHLHTVTVGWGYYWANRYYLDTLVIVENISLCTFWCFENTFVILQPI